MYTTSYMNHSLMLPKGTLGTRERFIQWKVLSTFVTTQGQNAVEQNI